MIINVSTYFNKWMLLGVLLCYSLNASAFFDKNSINNVFGECINNFQQNNTKVSKQRTKQTFTLSETTNTSRGVSFSYRANNSTTSSSSSTSRATAYQSKTTSTIAETSVSAQASSAAFGENLNSVFSSNAQQRSLGGIGGGNEGKPNNPPVTPITDVPLCFLALLAIGYTIYRKQTKTNA